jgi:hypothetical protein
VVCGVWSWGGVRVVCGVDVVCAVVHSGYQEAMDTIVPVGTIVRVKSMTESKSKNRDNVLQNDKDGNSTESVKSYLKLNSKSVISPLNFFVSTRWLFCTFKSSDFPSDGIMFFTKNMFSFSLSFLFLVSTIIFSSLWGSIILFDSFSLLIDDRA